MIFFLAGTSDARDLAVFLQSHGYSLLASVVTANAAKSLQAAGVKVRTGRLNLEQMTESLRNIEAKVLVDASHPFAEEAHKTAMQAAERCGIPYIRYERESKQYGNHPRVRVVDTYEEAAEVAARRKGSIMLTTGSKTLQVFTERLLQDPEVRLVARLLPTRENMEKCESLGLQARNIIGMQGPFSRELNHELYRHYGTTLMITKESGRRGSVDEKVEAALDLGIEVVVISRPKISYGTSFSTFDDLLEEVGRWLGK